MLKLQLVVCGILSFYGFTKRHIKELSQIDYKSKAKELKTIILSNGGYVPS